MEWLVISVASLFAGFVDAIVGGGGLILVPALFAVFPTTAPATLFGTNKTGSIWGTALSAWRYARRVEFDWPTLWPALTAAFLGSLFGSWVVTMVSADFMRKLLPFILLAVLLYTLARKDMGQVHKPLQSAARSLVLGCAIGLLIGFYDGFFGPGTGSFFVFALVRLLGYDFLNASANAKLLNIATNLATIILLGFKGYIWWHLMLPLAAANLVGSFLGTYMALRYGAGFVRWIFIGVVSLLIMRTAYDAFLR
ncbi:MAG: TSUP family transporter [Corticimicrobacter sp.]|uniref:sulfite exporter TauE/SafE family protein n=1 Tax=Corticimicrobacter sp. TaxID=2678536 RepID=UPI0032DA7F88